MQKLSIGNINDYTENFQELEPLAKNNDAYAQFFLGWMYENGKSISQNISTAEKWYTESANQNSIEAQYALGLLYEKNNLLRDYKKAIKWYKKACTRNEPKSQYRLARMYEKKLGSPRNYKKAIEHYSKSANRGNTKAQYKLGLIYDKVSQKPSCKLIAPFSDSRSRHIAQSFYHKVAEQGCAKVQNRLGRIYAENNYRKTEEIIRWQHKAAKQGSVDAQIALVIPYIDQYRGSTTNDGYYGIYAYMWLCIAYFNCPQDLKYFSEQLHIGNEKIMFAKAMAKRCIDSDYKDCGDEICIPYKPILKSVSAELASQILES